MFCSVPSALSSASINGPIYFDDGHFPLKRATLMANKGELDGQLSRVYNYANSHPDQIRVEEHHYTSGFLAFSTNPLISVNGWESLKGMNYAVCFARGSNAEEINLSRVVRPEKLNRVDGYITGFRMLAVKRCDIFSTSESIALEILISDEFKGAGIRIAGVLEQYTAHAYLYKKHKDLVPKLAKVLREMKSEGLLKKYRKATGYLTLFKEDGTLNKQMPRRD